MRRLKAYCPGVSGHSGCSGCPLQKRTPERPQVEIEPTIFPNGYCMPRRAAERNQRNR